MKLPALRDLTEDQRGVYLYAPNDKHVLVQGPPGTGKTLIACLRASELQQRGVPVVLGMFNRVLMQYASNAPGAGSAGMPVQTVRTWFKEWWYQAGLPPHPDSGDICLNVPYEQKDEARNAGARWQSLMWRPWQPRKQGVWVVSYEIWAAAPARFAAWRLYQAVPLHPGSTDEPDWAAVCSHLISHAQQVSDAALCIGTMLIDEGQDFAPGFYKVLALLSALGMSRGAKVAYPLRCFVLADENQQLTEFNSTLQDIQNALKIADENRYTLLDNFRNTREIAELARSFFDDVSVLPRLPDRRGERPFYTEYPALSTCIQRIINWVVNHPGKETGVLVFNDKARSAFQQALTAAVSRVKGRSIRVQSYSWATRATNPVNRLVFDQPDIITVLNMQSCKGLEFDAVFIANLHEASIGMYGPGKFRMQMFVGVSRAREWVQLIESQLSADDAAFRKELPAEQVLLREAGGITVAEPRLQMPAADAPTGSPMEDWAGWAKTFAKAQGCAYEDLRPSGCFWLYAPRTMAPELEKRGFRFTERRNGWWRI